MWNLLGLLVVLRFRVLPNFLKSCKNRSSDGLSTSKEEEEKVFRIKKKPKYLNR